MIEDGGKTLDGFSDPVPFRSENLSNISNVPGAHVVWDPAGELIYAGYTSQQRSRLQQHLTGDRQASILHGKVGRLLDDDLGRDATRDEIRHWLEQTSVAWKADSDPESLKARIIDEFHPKFNDVVPAADPDDGSDDVWDELVHWVRYFVGRPDFEKNERDYKIRLGAEFAHARQSVLAGDSNWLQKLEAGFKSKDNNLSRWNQHNRYLDWLRANPVGGLASIQALWNEDDHLAAIEKWSEATPKAATSGAGSRTMFASLLLLGVDATQYPPFKPTVLDNGYRLVGLPSGERSDESKRYQTALDFFDRIVEECRQRGVQLRDRLDAQGALWAILNTDTERVDDPERLGAFRGEPYAAVWWVNQGQTYDQERSGGYVWAPQKTEKGAVLGHWLNVSKLTVGDQVLHYANGAIRAISEVVKKGYAAAKPDGLGEDWLQEGYRADVEYHDLEDPIRLNEIAERRRIDEGGAFNRNGGVNQGYMYPLSATFSSQLYEMFADRWPMGSPWEPFTGNYWTFQGNPDYWDFDSGLAKYEKSGKGDWTAAQHRQEMEEGDLVAIWKAGPESGFYALAEIGGAPFVRDEEDRITSSRGDEWAVPLRYPEVLDPPILRNDLLSDPILGDLDVIRIRQGSNFRMTKEQWERLDQLISGEPAAVGSGSLFDVVGSVASGLGGAGLLFGGGHVGFVRSFVVSLATKGFVLLTGLSGSGKSRLGIGFGEWLGVGRWLVVPVRPDWTGPDFLLGFEDGLSSRDERGRLGWHVPEALEFMLKAASDPEHAYLLVLDEMNLAHVERYFADVLSGMESGVGVLPDLMRGSDGVWRKRGDDKLVFPRNLFVVGTVNIDETTHMFSPKVLDRANTLEFRVETGDLVASGGVAAVEAGPDEVVAGFLDAATSPVGEWSGRDELAGWLWELHGLLSEEDREFGHRVFYEALRFGGLLAEAGESDPRAALDLQVMQKVLPRMHGSIRQVSSILETIAKWCWFGPDTPLPEEFDPLADRNGDPALPVSFDKTRRMIRRLRANHFVSYAE